MRANRNAEWVADIEFVFAECVRIQQAVAAALKPPISLKDLPKEDMWGDLPHPSGRGTMSCGRAANRRIWLLAEQAIRHSDAAGTLEVDPVHKALGRILVQRFVSERRPIDERQAEKALSAAVREAKRARMNRVHYIPCRLMYGTEPSTFTIGPVTFYTLARFNEVMAPHFAAHAEKDTTAAQAERAALLLADARHYYDGFTWVGQVEILNCDGGTSLDRARVAVTGAVNLMHVLFGSYQTRRMGIGGPRLESDRRAHMSLDEKHGLYVSCSWSSTSAVGFSEGWGKFFEGEEMEILLRGAAKALEPIVNPAVQRPMGTRLLDAASWFGDAVREQSPAARIIKAITGLEALLLTSEHDDIAVTISERGAAVCYHPARNKTFAELRSELNEAYEMRSRLTHGSLSPFAPEVAAYAPSCLQLVEQVICWGLGLFESQGLFERTLTARQLAEGFGQLTAWAKEHSAAESELLTLPLPTES